MGSQLLAQLDLATVLTIFASSGIGSAAASAGFEWWTRSRHEKRSARYLAVRVAHTLEQYALQMCDLVWNHNLHIDSGGHGGKEIDELPKFPTLPEDEGYRLLPPDIVDGFISLTYRRKNAERYANFLWEVSDDDEIGSFYRRDTLKCALDAFDVAKRLRIQYSLKQDVDISKTEALWKENLKNLIAEEKRREEEERGSMDKLFAEN